MSTEDAEYLYPDRPALAAAEEIRDQGARVVLLTDGANDVRVVTEAGRIRVPVPRVAIADTGAGDSFCGGFVTWWHQRELGRPELSDGSLLTDATEFATAVSAVICQRVGADPPWAHELADAGWPWVASSARHARLASAVLPR